MPLPLMIGIATTIAAGTGVTSTVSGIKKISKAHCSLQEAEFEHERNIRRLEQQQEKTNNQMDELGKKELRILKSFQDFSGAFEKIHNKPEFGTISVEEKLDIEFNIDELRTSSVGAAVLLGAIEGAAVGTAGAFAASGATTAVMTVVGTSSTGTALSSLNGAALTNAVLAQLGGGSIAAGGGGVALGAAVLQAASLGVGVMVAGIAFNYSGTTMSKKANEAWEQIVQETDEVDKVCTFLQELFELSQKYYDAIYKLEKVYRKQLRKFLHLVMDKKKCDWKVYSETEKMLVENTVLLVSLMFGMCNVQLTIVDEITEGRLINSIEVEQMISKSEEVLCLA